MPTFLDDMRALADDVRGIPETDLPIRTVEVTVRLRTWPGKPGRPGDTPVDGDLVLPMRYKVRLLTAKEISGSGGRYEDGAVRVGPITPPFPDGGYSREDLFPTAGANREIIYVLSGEYSGEFSLATIDTTKPIGWWMTLNRSRRTP